MPLQVGSKHFVDLDEPYVFFNHSCGPNALIRRKNELVAIMDIPAGEEICYDYSASSGVDDPWEMSCPCACGGAGCRRVIKNVLSLPPTCLDHYMAVDGLQDHILDGLRLQRQVRTTR